MPAADILPAMPPVADITLRKVRHPLRTLCLVLWMTTLTGADSASAQYRFGVALGGAGFAALVAEYRWSHQGLEVQAGTWRFRDLSLSFTAKQYVGSYAVEPYAGVGFWGIVAGSETGTGFGLIARFPVGLGWDFASGHTAGVAIHFNRALVVKRPDPEDRRPPRGAFIPLPEISYRWKPGN